MTRINTTTGSFSLILGVARGREKDFYVGGVHRHGSTRIIFFVSSSRQVLVKFISSVLSRNSPSCSRARDHPLVQRYSLFQIVLFHSDDLQPIVSLSDNPSDDYFVDERSMGTTSAGLLPCSEVHWWLLDACIRIWYCPEWLCSSFSSG